MLLTKKLKLMPVDTPQRQGLQMPSNGPTFARTQPSQLVFDWGTDLVSGVSVPNVDDPEAFPALA